MKKFFKWSAIIAGILLAIGVMLVIISTAIGGRRALFTVGEGLKEVAWDELDDVLLSVDGLEFNIGEDGVKISLGDEGSKTLNINGISVAGSSQSESFPATDIRKLDLSIGAGEFVIFTKSVDDGKVDIFVTGAGECKYHVEEKTLVVDGFHKSFGINIGGTSKVVLEIPAGMSFEEVDAQIGAGIMDIEDMQTVILEASIGAGELNLENVKADDFSAEIGAGQLMAEEMDILNAEIDVSMGECDYDGWIRGHLEAKCDMGNLELDLKGKQSEHNYKIQCSAGNIDLEDYQMVALAGEKVIDNGAESEYEITCNMGNISVEFEKE